MQGAVIIFVIYFSLLAEDATEKLTLEEILQNVQKNFAKTEHFKG